MCSSLLYFWTRRYNFEGLCCKLCESQRFKQRKAFKTNVKNCRYNFLISYQFSRIFKKLRKNDSSMTSLMTSTSDVSIIDLCMIANRIRG